MHGHSPSTTSFYSLHLIFDLLKIFSIRADSTNGKLCPPLCLTTLQTLLNISPCQKKSTTQNTSHTNHKKKIKSTQCSTTLHFLHLQKKLRIMKKNILLRIKNWIHFLTLSLLQKNLPQIVDTLTTTLHYA